MSGIIGDNLGRSGGLIKAVAAAGGAFTFLESDDQTSGMVSSVEFEFADRTDYNIFRIVWYSLEQNSDDNYIRIQYKIAGAYVTSSYYGGTDGAYWGSSSGTSSNYATDGVRIAYGIKNNQDYPNVGYMDFYDPHNTDAYKSCGGVDYGPTSGGSSAMTVGTCGGYYYGGTGAVTHVKFLGQSTSTFQGEFFFYGFKTS